MPGPGWDGRPAGITSCPSLSSVASYGASESSPRGPRCAGCGRSVVLQPFPARPLSLPALRRPTHDTFHWRSRRRGPRGEWASHCSWRRCWYPEQSGFGAPARPRAAWIAAAASTTRPVNATSSRRTRVSPSSPAIGGSSSPRRRRSCSARCCSREGAAGSRSCPFDPRRRSARCFRAWCSDSSRSRWPPALLWPADFRRSCTASIVGVATSGRRPWFSGPTFFSCSAGGRGPRKVAIAAAGLLGLALLLFAGFGLLFVWFAAGMAGEAEALQLFIPILVMGAVQWACLRAVNERL